MINPTQSTKIADSRDTELPTAPHENGMKMHLAINNGSELSKHEKIDVLESELLNHPQVDCPVTHRFGPNIYIRELFMPAGTIAIGHRQKHKHLNNVVQGVVATTDDNGNLIRIKAPCTFIGEAGRKFGYVVEDVIWQNIYSTSETDIDKLEDEFLDKSDVWKEYDSKINDLSRSMRQVDRDDFNKFIDEYNLDASVVQQQSESTEDITDKPCGENITIRDSDISGRGVFLTHPVKSGDVIGVARVGDKRTKIGRYTNHSGEPNAYFDMLGTCDVFLIASKDINGCVGGSKGTEITIDYRSIMKSITGDKS